MSYPVDLVGRRPNGATIRQPCETERAFDDAVARLGRIAPSDTEWTVEPVRRPGAAVIEGET